MLRFPKTQVLLRIEFSSSATELNSSYPTVEIQPVSCCSILISVNSSKNRCPFPIHHQPSSHHNAKTPGTCISTTLNIFRQHLTPLPNLNLQPAPQHTNPHRREQIMRRIQMVINTAIKHRRSILPNRRRDQRFPTRMILHKAPNIMNHAPNSHQRFTLFRPRHKFIPFNHRQLIQRHAPIQTSAVLVNLLLQLLNTTFLDLVSWEGFKVTG